MAGKPLIVAILAGIIVAMIGVVFLQNSPEGFVVSGLMRVGEAEQQQLEEQLQKEAAAQLAAEKEKALDPASIALLKSSQQGETGVDVAIQAQGKNSRSAVDYLNELMVRYARRQGKIEETVKVKQEIADADRKLETVVKEQQAAFSRIQSTEKEIEQIQRREQLEAQRVAQETKTADESDTLPAVEAPAAVSKIPTELGAPSNPERKKIQAPELPVLDDRIEAAPPVRARANHPQLETTPADEGVDSEPMAKPLSEEERLELTDALKIYKSDRTKLIHGGRRSNHPKVKEIEDLIRETERKLKAGSRVEGAHRKVNFAYAAAPSGKSEVLSELQKARARLEKELAGLRKRLERATQTEASLKKTLVKLIAEHAALDATFKPVILAPAKVVSRIEGPFPFGRLVGVIAGSVIAAVVGFLVAKLGEEKRVLSSIAEAEAILRMPVQTLEKPTVRRRAA